MENNTIHFSMSSGYGTVCNSKHKFTRATNELNRVTCFNCLAVLESSKGKPLPFERISSDAPTLNDMMELCKRHIDMLKTALRGIESELDTMINKAYNDQPGINE